MKEIVYYHRGGLKFSPEDSFTKSIASNISWEDESFTYKPIEWFEWDNQEFYQYDQSHKSNLLTLKSVSWDNQKNIVIAYYKKYQKTNISSVTVKVAKAVYNGKKQEPQVTVTYNNQALKLNTDYTVSYKNAKKVGRSAVEITGIGTYTGVKSVDFDIRPKTSKISSVKKTGKGKATVKLKKSKGAAGYQITYATNKKFRSSKKKSSKKNTVTLKGLKSNKVYYIKARAYAKIKGKKVYSSYSPVKKVNK